VSTPATGALQRVSAGTRLGDYEILARLAAGGMAEIYLARLRKMTSFQKMVVIKRILPELAQNSDFIEMFLDEARIAATLEHPHIVQTYDVGVVDGSYYIAMEYLHGEDVRSIMKELERRQRRMPLPQALNIIISAAGGLHYAHEKVGFEGHPLEIVHRDVSPQNLFVTYAGGIKLLDFGIARASNRLRETRIGTLKGKVPYMSPEQCQSEALDRRSDIYSLGILLYELTLSRRLYAGSNDFEVLKEIVEGEVTPPRQIDPCYPEALESIVMRALAKSRDERWATARDMQAALEGFVFEERLHIMPMGIQQFMEELFGNQIEAWRQAQSQGKTLDEHLLTAKSTHEDSQPFIEADPVKAERLRAERAAFVAQLEKKSLPPPSAQPQRLRTVFLVALAGALLVAAVAKLKLVPPPARAQPPTVVIAPPSEPLTMAQPMQSLPTEPAPSLRLPQPAASAPPPRSPSPPRPPHRSRRSSSTTESPVTPAPSEPVAPPAAATTPESEPAPSAPAAPAPNPADEVTPHLEGDGTLVVASSPWCRVIIDGVDRGATPLRIKLPAGAHTLLLTNPEFNVRRTFPVTIEPGQTLRKRIDFIY
jgi:serine/threonine protein kinase